MKPRDKGTGRRRRDDNDEGTQESVEEEERRRGGEEETSGSGGPGRLRSHLGMKIKVNAAHHAPIKAHMILELKMKRRT